VERVDIVETHISWVLLTGRYAYKIKKPVDLGFLDFSSLDRREHFCREELRLNRRTAPDLYLDVVAISGSITAARVGGGGRAIEYAVQMRQFEHDRQLDRLTDSGGISVEEMADFGARMAALYDTVSVDREGRFGGAEQVGSLALDNLTTLSPLLEARHAEVLARLRSWTQEVLRDLVEQFAERQAGGFIRECHGDLHLSNLVKLDSGITAFDCIEFDPALRWIDTISDVAFLVMDIDSRGRSELASSFLNAYLEKSGDYSGVRLLRFYLVYRSLVRCKVAALRLGQSGLLAEERARAGEKLQRHLELAAALIEAPEPRVILMHGLAASGKTTWSARLMLYLPAVRIRSDVERKRRALLDADLYSRATSRATYERLVQLAGDVVEGGFTVVVDAAFLRREERRRFYELARRLGVEWRILACRAGDDTKVLRLRRRGLEGKDASDADEQVLAWQRRTAEPLEADERARAVEIHTDREVDMAALLDDLRPSLLRRPSGSL